MESNNKKHILVVDDDDRIRDLIKEYLQEKNFIVSTRAGNVIGGGDWSDNRLIPDCIKSWTKKRTVKISKLSTAMSHLRVPHSLTYCPTPHNSYFGRILEFVKDI